MIILFFLQLSYTRTQLILHVLCKHWSPHLLHWTISVAAINTYTHNIQLLLSPTSSKVSMLSCDSCPSIAHYAQHAQLSQVCVHVANSSNFVPCWANLTMPELFFFYKRTYYSQRNSQNNVWRPNSAHAQTVMLKYYTQDRNMKMNLSL